MWSFVGDASGWVVGYCRRLDQASRFLARSSDNPELWDLLPFVDTEAKQKAVLSGRDDAAVLEHLGTLVTNVILLADGDGHNFHPRIDLAKTSSFAALKPEWQGPLLRLYNDYFYERQETLWRAKALEKLPALRGATDMLVCGEDLGMVPACVPGVMADLSILSLEVQRMPKDPKILFGNPSSYPYMAVCTTSSHDTSTLRGWWEENRTETVTFARSILGLTGPVPAECTPEIAWKVVEQHAYSPCCWLILPIQDYMATYGGLSSADPTAERINVPANPVHYWRWRLTINLDDFYTSATGAHFHSHIRKLLVDSGRVQAYDAASGR